MGGVPTRRRPNTKTKLDYPTMSMDEIKSIPMDQIANVGCHVYCWTTNKYLRETFNVLESWNVNYHLTLVWTKHNGMTPNFAYKFATEFCLLGFYKKPDLWIKGKPLIPLVFQAENIKHSKKPDKFYQMIEPLGKDRIDIFARNKRQGWDVIGNEV